MTSQGHSGVGRVAARSVGAKHSAAASGICRRTMLQLIAGAFVGRLEPQFVAIADREAAGLLV